MQNDQTETELRQDLSACLHSLDHYGMSDLVSGHASAKIPGSGSYLINPYGHLFSEVTASGLVDVGLYQGEAAPIPAGVNPAGYTIHTAIHEARPDIGCVIHVHSLATMGVSCQKEGLLPITQHALQFFGKIGYHDYDGIALDPSDAAALANKIERNHAIMLRNHGIIVVGRTIAEAFTSTYNLDVACRVQLVVQSSQAELNRVPENICALTASQHEGFANQDFGEAEWTAVKRDTKRRAPHYAH